MSFSHKIEEKGKLNKWLNSQGKKPRNKRKDPKSRNKRKGNREEKVKNIEMKKKKKKKYYKKKEGNIERRGVLEKK